jgi:hypothetical protein
MDLLQLDYFRATARVPHVTRAAAGDYEKLALHVEHR